MTNNSKQREEIIILKSLKEAKQARGLVEFSFDKMYNSHRYLSLIVISLVVFLIASQLLSNNYCQQSHSHKTAPKSSITLVWLIHKII